MIFLNLNLLKWQTFTYTTEAVVKLWSRKWKSFTILLSRNDATLKSSFYTVPIACLCVCVLHIYIHIDMCEYIVYIDVYRYSYRNSYRYKYFTIKGVSLYKFSCNCNSDIQISFHMYMLSTSFFFNCFIVCLFPYWFFN